VNEGGIMDLWVREARLFKYGSGTGTNFSTCAARTRSSPAAARAQGLMSWLKIGDRAASAIKSGGTTRRAAKMVCLDMDHPDIAEFINWKVREEIKVAGPGRGHEAAEKHKDSERADRLGLKLDYDFNGEAYFRPSAVRTATTPCASPTRSLTPWMPTRVDTSSSHDGQVPRTLQGPRSSGTDRLTPRGIAPTRACSTTPRSTRGTPARAADASTPATRAASTCSSTTRRATSRRSTSSSSTTPRPASSTSSGYEHAIDLWTMVLEISVLMAAFPSKEIAELSWKYRTLGLGYANLGAMLMQAGIPYDSDEGRAVCGC
jgi:ribonucleoside-diphosphate reductase alpha chain